MEAQVKRTRSEDEPVDYVCVEILTAAVHNREAPKDEEDDQESQVVEGERRKYLVPSKWASGIPLWERAFVFPVERDINGNTGVISHDAHASCSHLPDGQKKLVRHLLDVTWSEEYICDAAWEEIGQVTVDTAMRTPEVDKEFAAEMKKNNDDSSAYSRVKAKCLQTEVEKAKEKFRNEKYAFVELYSAYDDRVFSRFLLAKDVKRAAADTIADYSIFVVFLELPF